MKQLVNCWLETLLQQNSFRVANFVNSSHQIERFFLSSLLHGSKFLHVSVCTYCSYCTQRIVVCCRMILYGSSRASSFVNAIVFLTWRNIGFHYNKNDISTSMLLQQICQAFHWDQEQWVKSPTVIQAVATSAFLQFSQLLRCRTT